MTDIVLQTISTGLALSKPEYTVMAKNIDKKLPLALQNASNFYKGHSQFMQVTLDVTSLTPLRSIYHTLAEIEQTRAALQENHIRMLKADIERRRKEAKLLEAVDPFDRELLELEIFETNTGAATSKHYMEGAIRKLNFLVNQHENLLAKIGKSKITEEDYEREERRYHIMTCFKQALCAARARNGIIDEGNLIYIFELGINQTHAQAELVGYLTMEESLIAQGEVPTHDMTVEWLESMADKFEGHATAFAEKRGFTVLDKQSLVNTLRLEDA